MKKRVVLPAIFACIAIGIIAFVFAAMSGRRPFKDLQASDIIFAKAHLIPPDKKIEITEIPEFVALLQEVVIYKADDSYQEYDGQGVIFTLTMADGTETSIMAYNPFVIIDGAGYRTKYEPCEALNGYANRLLCDENAVTILEEPPILSIISDEIYHDTLLGTYSWESKNVDGTIKGTCADSAHPLDCKELLEPFVTETSEMSARLRFTEEPDAILDIRCWSDEHWSDPTAESEAVPINGNQITLKTGGYIYEVTAKWDAEKNGYGGIAHYSFYIRALE